MIRQFSVYLLCFLFKLVKKGFDLQFSEVSIQNFVGLRLLRTEEMDELTLSMWYKVKNASQVKNPTVFSYATKNNANELLLMQDNAGKLIIELLKTRIYTPMVLDESLTHLILTWTSSTGDLVLYENGVIKFSQTGIHQGRTVSGEGYLVLGQEQDTPLGGYLISQSFIGLVGEVNLWDRVLPQSELQELSRKCWFGKLGNRLAWNYSVLQGIRGNVGFIKPQFCT